MTEYLSIHEAIDWAKEELGRRVREKLIINFLLKKRMSVYFTASCDLHGVAIHHPDGRLEAIKIPVPFNGILQAKVPPCSVDRLIASIVEVAYVRGKRFRYERQVNIFSKLHELVAGCALPTSEDHGGYILPGYSVEAILDCVQISRENWLICTDELRELFDEPGTQERYRELLG